MQYTLGMGKKILIVEDKSLDALGLSDVFEKWGYEVCGTAFTGERAIRLAEDLQPDLITMDVRIKGEVDGIEAAKRIRARRLVPIIFLSGYLKEDMAKELGEMDAVEFLTKPVDEGTLKDAVNKFLDGVARA